MNLHDLVKLRNDLKNSIDISIIQNEIEHNITRLERLTNNIDNDFVSEITALINQHKNKIAILAQDVEQSEQIQKFIQSKITSQSSKFFADNYQLEIAYKEPEAIRRVRIMAPNEEFESYLLKRIGLHSTWKYPALEIGCRDGKWTKYLVASDPLYIADYFPEFISSSIKQFPSLYQDRIRKYIIHDWHKINGLPKNAFNFIFSYNFFNYLSIDSIKQLLIQSLDWLKPGGSIIFTYNNADLHAGAAYAESYFMTYVPKSILVPMAESLGFVETFSIDLDPAFSLLELSKPGELKTVKNGQVLGEIKLKS